MRKSFAGVLATVALLVPTALANGQEPAAGLPCPVMPSAQPALQHPDAEPDVIAVFAGSLREGTRVTVGLMDNQKLKGEFLGVRDDRLLFRADRDRSVTLRISLSAIHSVKVRNGGRIERPWRGSAASGTTMRDQGPREADR